MTLDYLERPKRTVAEKTFYEAHQEKYYNICKCKNMVIKKSAQNLGRLLIFIGWGESGKVILQVSIAVFRALPKKFSSKDGSAPLEKIGPYAYAAAADSGDLIYPTDRCWL